MFRKHITFRWLVPATAIVVVCAAPAAAAGAMTVTLGTPNLTGRVAITVPVTVTCSAFDPSLTLSNEGINMQVEQASGRAIAHGASSSFGFVPNLLFPCDGSQSTIPI